MAYTYQDYLNDQNQVKEQPSGTYKYSDFMADQEEENKIREWLKTQNRENVPITPEIRQRYSDFMTRPGIKPEDVNTELTRGEKIAASPPVQALATSGERVWKSMAQPYETASMIGNVVGRALNPFPTPQITKKVTEWGPGSAVTKTVAPQNILDIAAESMKQTGSNIGEAGAPSGSAIDVGVGGLTDAATLAIKMAGMSGAGVPQRGVFPLESSVSGLTESVNRGEGVGQQTKESIKKFATGYVLDKVLSAIPDATKNVIKQYGLNTLALTAIPEVSNAIDRIEKGEDPLKIDVDSMVRGLGVTALLPLIFGVHGEKPLTEKQINETNRKSWEYNQLGLREKELNERIMRSMEENLNRPKKGPTTISQTPKAPEAKVPKPRSEVPERTTPHGGVGGEGLSIEELLAQPAVRITFDSYGNPSNIKSGSTGEIRAGGLQPEKGERIFVGDSTTKTVYEMTNGVPVEITDPKIIKTFTESGGFIKRTEAPENIIEQSALPTAEERAALGIKDVPASREVEPTITEPQKTAGEMVPNKHAERIVDTVEEIRNNREELAEILQPWEGPQPAEHLKMNLDEQSRLAKEVQSNPELARDVAINGLDAFSKRDMPVPKDKNGHAIKAEAIWVAEKNKAIANNDVDYLLDLAKNSPVQEQISQAGKSLVLLRNRNPHDPVYQIMEINKEARATLEKSLGNKKVKEASDKRVAELEKTILAQQAKITQLENKKALDGIKYEIRKKGRIRAKEDLKLEFDDLAKALNKEFSSQMNIGLDPKVIRLMSRMAVNRVESGMKTIEQVVDDIYMTVKDIKGIDKRMIRDAITGYGKTVKLSKDEIDKDLREVRRQGRLVSMLEDAEAGIAPLRTGLQRDKPSERVKQLRQQVEVAMRENGLIIEKTAKSPEEEQLTAIQKYKNYLEKREAALTKKLLDGDYEIKPRKKTIIDAQLQSAKENVDRLSKTHRSLKEINQLRETGIKREEAQRIIDLSKTVAQKKDAVTDWSDRSVEGPAREYGRSLVEFFNYSNGLKQRARKLTGKEILSKMRYEPMQSIGRGLSAASGVSKSMLASMDNSALGRQGIKMLWSHPKIWAKNAKQSFIDIARQFKGREVLDEIMADVLSRPNAVNGMYGKMKLDVGNIEEAYPSQFPEKIPFYRVPYKASEVAFMGFQYRNRADAADIYLKLAEKMGVDIVDKTQLESIGNLVNTLTGRGKLGKSMERMSGPMNNVFFAPKFFKSNFDFLTSHMLVSDTPFVRKQAAINLMKFVAGSAAVLSVAKALGADIELDPRSSDFGKIRMGSTRFDVTGGVAAVATLATRLLIGMSSGVGQIFGGKPLGATKSSTTGKITPLTSGKPFTRNTMDVFYDAIEGKLAPLAALVKNISKGVDNNRKPLTLENLILTGVLPIGIQNIIQDLPNKDRVPIVASWLADAIGIGTSTYGKKKKKKVEWYMPKQ